MKVYGIGSDDAKILVVDDFSDSLADIQKVACGNLDYRPDGKTSYPGLRACLPDDYVHHVLAFCEPLLRSEFSIPQARRPEVSMAYFSLLTTNESELSVMQRLPHFDTTKRHYYAVLHYLNEGEFGGTGFFRHLPTGFEAISTEKRELYQQSVLSFMAVKGFPQPGYMGESSRQFQCYEKVDYRCNRLVMYPGRLLHSGLVSQQRDVCSDPARGRLTANVFIDFETS